MHGATPPLPQYAFMAWCSVKKRHRDKFTFSLQPWRRIVIVLQIKRLPSSETAVDTNRFCTTNTSYGCLTAIPEKGHWITGFYG
jgi:hypothetical protein